MSDTDAIVDSHDHLCPRANLEEAWNGADCACDLITRVRSEEFTHRITAAAASADMAYGIALEDAVKAITRLCHHTKYEGCYPCPHDDSVHAIEALGENE